MDTELVKKYCGEAALSTAKIRSDHSRLYHCRNLERIVDMLESGLDEYPEASLFYERKSVSKEDRILDVVQEIGVHLNAILSKEDRQQIGCLRSKIYSQARSKRCDSTSANPPR